MIERYARFVYRRHRAILAVSIGALMLWAVAFGRLGDRVSVEFFQLPGAESQRANDMVEDEFDSGLPNLVLVIGTDTESVDSPVVEQVGRDAAARLAAEPDVTEVVSYWSPERPPTLRNEDGTRGLVIARIDGDLKFVSDRVEEIEPRFHSEGGPVDVSVGGYALYTQEGTEITQGDLAAAELVTAPITLAALLIIFGSLVAAAVPLAMAAFLVLGTGTFLWMLTYVMDVSNFGLFFTTVLGLGLAVDYSLFIISRFREELARTGDTEAAIVNTIGSAGHTVMFSAIAVGISLVSLMLVPVDFFRSIAFAGLGTAALAGVTGMLVLPALLSWLGPRINRIPVWKGSVQAGDGKDVWYRAARRTMRRPLLVTGVVLAVLAPIALQGLGFKAGLTDDRFLGQNAETRRTGDTLRSEFTSLENTPIPVVLPHVRSDADAAEIDSFARQLATVEGVIHVDTATGSYTPDGARRDLPPALADRFASEDSTYLSVASSADPLSDAGRRQIADLRSLASPFDEVLVGGDAAVAIDITDAVTDVLPFVLLFVMLASFLTLMVQFRSIVAPLLAIGLTFISLSVVFGLLVWIFQEGHLQDFLGFTSLGTLLITIPILIFGFAFGLSMDYQVFLYSRIKEEYDRTGDFEGSIAYGLGRSGRIMSAAASVIAIVFIASGVMGTTFFAKAFGLLLGLLVLMDAFVIRGTLLPALMKLIGPRMWWAPSWLRREAPAPTPTPLLRVERRNGSAPARADQSALRASVELAVSRDRIGAKIEIGGHVAELALNGQATRVLKAPVRIARRALNGGDPPKQ